VVIIKVVGISFPEGITPCAESDRFLCWLNVEQHDGRAPIPTTDDPGKAHRFKDPPEAVAFWHTQSKVKPRRTDGLPNRPLTAYTIEIVQLIEAVGPLQRVH
jgi:hypothetical protein